jgi:hypothetical protein
VVGTETGRARRAEGGVVLETGRAKREEGTARATPGRISLDAIRRLGVRVGERFNVADAEMCGVALYLDTLDGLGGAGLEVLRCEGFDRDDGEGRGR